MSTLSYSSMDSLQRIILCVIESNAFRASRERATGQDIYVYNSEDSYVYTQWSALP